MAELVVRVSKKHGTQLVKVSAGRWTAKARATFLAALTHTGCVRAAARACGFSTTALYKRKDKYPDFAAAWRAAEAEAAERVPALLNAAAIAALDPEIDEADLPPVSVDQALHICKMKGFGAPAARERAAQRNLPRVATKAEVREALEKRLAAFRERVRAEDLAAGWTEHESGRLIPPGWVPAGRDAAGGQADAAAPPALPGPGEGAGRAGHAD